MKIVLSLVRVVPLLVFLLAANTASAFYDPAIGKWISRDPIGERGGANISAFLANDSVNEIDPLGLACGKFKILSEYTHPSKAIGETRTGLIIGFELRYDPGNPDQCCKCGTIVLVQAIKSKRWSVPQFDASDAQRRDNIHQKGTAPFPPYNPPGIEDPRLGYSKYSYVDSPESGKWYLEACAICRQQGKPDAVVGCVAFTFQQKPHELCVPGGKDVCNGLIYEQEAADPGGLWKAAVDQWTHMPEAQ